MEVQVPEGSCYLSYCPPDVLMMPSNLDGGDTQKELWHHETFLRLLVEERQLTTEQLLMETFSWRICYEENLSSLRGLHTDKHLSYAPYFCFKMHNSSFLKFPSITESSLR